MSIPSSRFAPHLGARFSVDAQPHPVELVLQTLEHYTLAASDPRRSGVPGLRSDPFALRFKGRREEPLAQGLYRVIDPEGEPLELFLVPVGPWQDGLLYEAVFN
jgi:hypothetical protein